MSIRGTGIEEAGGGKKLLAEDSILTYPSRGSEGELSDRDDVSSVELEVRRRLKAFQDEDKLPLATRKRLHAEHDRKPRIAGLRKWPKNIYLNPQIPQEIVDILKMDRAKCETDDAKKKSARSRKEHSLEDARSRQEYSFEDARSRQDYSLEDFIVPTRANGRSGRHNKTFAEVAKAMPVEQNSNFSMMTVRGIDGRLPSISTTGVGSSSPPEPEVKLPSQQSREENHQLQGPGSVLGPLSLQGSTHAKPPIKDTLQSQFDNSLIPNKVNALPSVESSDREEGVAPSTVELKSSIGKNRTHGTSESGRVPSTLPPSVSKTRPSLGSNAPKSAAAIYSIVEEPEQSKSNKGRSQSGDPLVDFDIESLISADSVVVLSQNQKGYIVKRFTEALSRDVARSFSMPHDFYSSKQAFYQCFPSLIKKYSSDVKCDTTDRSRKQAAKHINILRNDILKMCEDKLLGNPASADEGRGYPTIVREAQRFNLPEMTFKEKVSAWVSGKSHLEGHSEPCEIDERRAPAADSDLQPTFGNDSSDIIGTAGNDSQEVPFNAADENDIHNYLINHDAFRHLVSEVQKLLERHSNQMELTQHRVLLSIRRPVHFHAVSPGRHRAIFHLEWDIISFLLDEHFSGLLQDLGSLVTITGCAADSHLCTIHSYLKTTWSMHSSMLLEAVQSVIDRSEQGINSASETRFESQGNEIVVGLDLRSMTVTGSEGFLVTIAQQLSWLVAACRASPSELVYSYPSFREEESTSAISIPTFRISSEIVPLSPQEPRCCWNEVVGRSVIVAGFPIPERFRGEIGLELPIQVMAGLAGVPLATNYRGGYLLKGQSVIFVPVKRLGDSVQWHLAQGKNGRVAYRDVSDLCPLRLPIEKLDQNALSTTRAFLGWCPKSVNNVACTHSPVNYNRIGYSKINRASKRVVTLTGGSLGFSKIGTASLNFSFGRHMAPFSAEKPEFYGDLLDRAKQLHVIFQDMQDRRAWQTDGERTILQIIMHRCSTWAYTTNGKQIELQSAVNDNADSPRDAMIRNADITVALDEHLPSRTVKRKVFRDLVVELFHVLDGFKERVEDMNIDGIDLMMSMRKFTYGNEYMNLVHKRYSEPLKEALLKKTCGRWPDYARAINAVVLFGTDFGELFRPLRGHYICPQFRTMPRGKDLLAVEV